MIPAFTSSGSIPSMQKGSAVRRTEIIKKGVINAFLHNRESLAEGGERHCRPCPGHAR